MSTMMLRALFGAIWLNSLVLAAPYSSPSSTTSSLYPEATYCTKSQKLGRALYDVNFDDITTIPASARNVIPIPYDQLYFQAWSVVNSPLANGGQPGPAPHSPPNFIVSDSVLQVQNGQPLVSTIYKNSNITALDLFSFYFACVASLPDGVTSTNAQCDVIVTGYRGSTNTISEAYEVCSHTYSYTPPTAIAGTQQAYTGLISDCRNIQFFTIDYFATGFSSGTTTATAVLLDDLQVAVYNCTS